MQITNQKALTIEDKLRNPSFARQYLETAYRQYLDDGDRGAFLLSLADITNANSKQESNDNYEKYCVSKNHDFGHISYVYN